MFLGHTIFQIYCGSNLWYVHVVLFIMINIVYFYINISASKVFSAQCYCFQYFADFLLGRCVIHVVQNFFVVVSNCSCYYWYNFCFHFPRGMYFYPKFFIFENILLFFLDHISPAIAIFINQTCLHYYRELFCPV